MFAFGLILALVGIGGTVLVGWLVLQSSSAVTIQGASVTVSVLPITVFVVAAGLILVIWLGWRLMVLGRRRRRAQRDEIERLRSTSAQAQSQPRAEVPAAATTTGPGARPTTTGVTGGQTAPTEPAPARPASAAASADATTKSDTAAPRATERQVRGPMD